MESWQISWNRVVSCFYIRLGTFIINPMQSCVNNIIFILYEETKKKWFPYGCHNEASWLICVICWDIVKGTFFRGWGNWDRLYHMGKGPIGFHECFEVQYISRRYELNNVCLFENKQYLMQILDLCLITIYLFNRPQKITLCDCSCKVTGIIANPQISDLLAILELLTSVTDEITL